MISRYDDNGVPNLLRMENYGIVASGQGAGVRVALGKGHAVLQTAGALSLITIEGRGRPARPARRPNGCLRFPMERAALSHRLNSYRAGYRRRDTSARAALTLRCRVMLSA